MVSNGEKRNQDLEISFMQIRPCALLCLGSTLEPNGRPVLKVKVLKVKLLKKNKKLKPVLKVKVLKVKFLEKKV